MNQSCPSKFNGKLGGKSVGNRVSRAFDRKQVYEKIFFGHQLEHTEMFANPGFRGISVLPYPDHIKNMISSLSPEKKSKGNPLTQIFSGHEIMAENQVFSQSPWRGSSKQLIGPNGKKGSSRNLFEIAFSQFEQQKKSAPKSPPRKIEKGNVLMRKLEQSLKMQLKGQLGMNKQTSANSQPTIDEIIRESGESDSLTNSEESVSSESDEQNFSPKKEKSNKLEAERLKKLQEQQQVFSQKGNKFSKKIYAHFVGDILQEEIKSTVNLQNHQRLQKKRVI